jgi:hypothetical protein
MANGPQEIDLIQWASKLAFEIIGQAGLGYSFGTFEGRNDEFLRAIKQWLSVPDRLNDDVGLTCFLGQLVTL